jgi:hypothetical protein
MAFIPLSILPVNFALQNTGDLADFHLTDAMIVAINQYLNSEEHTRKLLELCEERAVVRCEIVRTDTGFCLVNRQAGVGPRRTLNMFTGILVNSYEAPKEKGGHTHGVISDRKISITFEIQQRLPGGEWTDWEKHDIILVGWRADSGILNRVNRDIPGGAEFCAHSCDPNCDLVTASQTITGEFEVNGVTYQFRYSPIFLETRIGIPVGVEPTADYGTDMVCKPKNDCKPELYYGWKRREVGRHEMRTHFRSRGITLERDIKRMKHDFGWGSAIPGIECLCQFCTDTASDLKRARTLIFAQQMNSVNYDGVLDILFDRTIRFNPRRLQIQFRTPAQRDYYQHIVHRGIGYDTVLRRNMNVAAVRARRNTLRRINEKKGLLIPPAKEGECCLVWWGADPKLSPNFATALARLTAPRPAPARLEPPPAVPAEPPRRGRGAVPRPESRPESHDQSPADDGAAMSDESWEPEEMPPGAHHNANAGDRNDGGDSNDSEWIPFGGLSPRR